MTLAQSPPATNDAVVAPLWPWLMPQEGGCRKERKPLPQPPFMAVVESPARKKAGGLSRVFVLQGHEAEVGDAVVIVRVVNIVRRIVIGAIIMAGIK